MCVKHDTCLQRFFLSTGFCCSRTQFVQFVVSFCYSCNDIQHTIENLLLEILEIMCTCANDNDDCNDDVDGYDNDNVDGSSLWQVT